MKIGYSAWKFDKESTHNTEDSPYTTTKIVQLDSIVYIEDGKVEHMSNEQFHSHVLSVVSELHPEYKVSKYVLLDDYLN